MVNPNPNSLLTFFRKLVDKKEYKNVKVFRFSPHTQKKKQGKNWEETNF